MEKGIERSIVTALPSKQMTQGNENFSKGAFILSRSIFESDLWFMPPEYLKVWIYIIGQANHKGRKVRGYPCERGEYFCDYHELSEQLRYSIGYRKSASNESHMKNLMKFLRDTGRITTMKKPRGILINVLNYSKYQDLNNYEKTTEKTDEQTSCKLRSSNIALSINKNVQELLYLRIQENDRPPKEKKPKPRTPAAQVTLHHDTQLLFDRLKEGSERRGIPFDVNIASLDVYVQTNSERMQCRVNMFGELTEIFAWCIRNKRGISTRFIGNWFKKGVEIMRQKERDHLEWQQNRKNGFSTVHRGLKKPDGYQETHEEAVCISDEESVE